MFKRIDHVGIVVNSLDESLETYCDQLGFRLLERQNLPEHKVEVAFLDAKNGTIELLAPTDPTSGTAQFLQKRGEGTHHICFEVDDIKKTLSELHAQGTRLIDEVPRQGVHGLVAFVHPRAAHGTMIELLQKDTN
ncbi:methylmalonyl-CoA epimerase [Chloroflexi bacterium TSY]|nr:methylmalonyl-CoA epimerase [Chloroflexi bacterium TSY]